MWTMPNRPSLPEQCVCPDTQPRLAVQCCSMYWYRICEAPQGHLQLPVADVSDLKSLLWLNIDRCGPYAHPPIACTFYGLMS